jgi:hypothetical protein
MIEQSLHELFQQMAAQDLPPDPVVVPQVIRQGGSRRRWRRFRVALAPALAAASVLAIALTTAALPAHNPAGRQREAPALVQPSVAVHLFSVRSPYASFGWLPAGPAMNPMTHLGTMRPEAEALDAGNLALITFAPGICHLAGSKLNCSYNVISCGHDPRLERRAPAINGHLAYWVSFVGSQQLAATGVHCLAWEYSPGGWAVIDSSGPANMTDQVVARAARAVTFSEQRPLLKFPAQLVGMPGRWEVVSAGFGLAKGSLVGTGFDITNGRITVTLWTPLPAVGSGQCESQAEHCYLINGYHVNENIDDPRAILVDRNADGLQVSLWGPKNQLRLLRTIFAHLKLLGPNPSDWTTRPVR